MATRNIRTGDRVRITGTESRFDGRRGTVMQVMRADRFQERRARVLVLNEFFDEAQPTIAMKYLERITTHTPECIANGYGVNYGCTCPR